MEILKVENLSKVYGKDSTKVVALDNVSFSVEKGEFSCGRRFRFRKIDTVTFTWRSR